jgi:diguanylate cyclase (GGDEF)-like protein
MEAEVGPRDRRASDHAARAFARSYGDALRAADGACAERVVADALAAGMAASAVHVLVIQPALVRIGELWEQNVITPADEHLATAISHSVLVKLFDELTSAHSRSRERVMLAAVEGQHHTLGLRMIADVLEGSGFEVLYLGADVPVDALGRFAAQHQPAVTGLAFGVSVGVDVLADSINTVHDACPRTRIMLGGRAVPPGLVAAGYPLVDSSMEVVLVVEGLLRNPAMAPSEILPLLLSPRRRPRDERETSFSSDPVAERIADVAESATDTARDHVRRAGAFRELAFRDPVTELGNRRAFDDRIFQESARDDAAGGSLLMLDVDDFKTINDTYGHDVGDTVLRSIGVAITNSTRACDFAARVGGDEFAVLLPRSGPEDARKVGARIRAAVALAAGPRVTVSVGVSALSDDARGSVLAADSALYAAKRSGRDCLRDGGAGVRGS